jgi:LuxR family maltose regulon positive regulatory protein
MSTSHDDLIEHSVDIHWSDGYDPGQPLTQSENRVLRYLPTHLSGREIANELCLSENTVKTHLRHLYQKLGAHSRHDAVQRARAIGLLAVSARTS